LKNKLLKLFIYHDTSSILISNSFDIKGPILEHWSTFFHEKKQMKVNEEDLNNLHC